MQTVRRCSVLLFISLFHSTLLAGPGGPDGDEILFRSGREVQLFASLIQNQAARNRITSLGRRYSLMNISTHFQALPAQSRNQLGQRTSYYCSFEFALRGSKSKFRRRLAFQGQAGIEGGVRILSVTEKNIRRRSPQTTESITAQNRDDLVALLDAFLQPEFTEELSSLLRRTRIQQICFNEVRNRASQIFTIRIFHRRRPAQVINQTVWHGRYTNRGNEFLLLQSIGK